jgi:hypothetical protein
MIRHMPTVPRRRTAAVVAVLIASLVAGAATADTALAATAAPSAVRGALTTYDAASGRSVPAVGITVSLENPDRLGIAVATATTDEAGGFALNSVEPGSYVLAAEDMRAGDANSGVTRQYYQSYALPGRPFSVQPGATFVVEYWDVFRGATLVAGVSSGCDTAGSETRVELLSSPQFPPFGFSRVEPVTLPTISEGVITYSGLHANGESYAMRVVTSGDHGRCARLLGPFRPTAGGRVDTGEFVLRPEASGFDYDGDALSDVVVRGAGGLLSYRGDGAGGWLPTQRIGDSWWQGMNLMIRATGFAEPGEPDLLGRDTAGNLILWRGYGMPGTGWARTNQIIGSGWNSMSAVFSGGDFDGDGNPDLLARDAAGDLWVYPGDGGGGFLDRKRIGTGWNVLTQLFSMDMNGDGRVDILGRQNNGVLVAYLGDGAGGWATGRGVHVGSGWGIFDAVFDAGDFDGDGHGDVLGRDARSGNLVLYRTNGRGGWLGGGSGRVVGTGWGGLSFPS